MLVNPNERRFASRNLETCGEGAANLERFAEIELVEGGNAAVSPEDVACILMRAIGPTQRFDGGHGKQPRSRSAIGGQGSITGENAPRAGGISIQANEIAEVRIGEVLEGSGTFSGVVRTDQQFGGVELVGNDLKMAEGIGVGGELQITHLL